MSGIYIHIPFCKQACNYCDFHFSTSLQKKEEMVLALATELKLRKNEFEKEKIETIYFGGGTPSILTNDEINLLLATVFDNYTIVNNPEITLEANPDDLSKDRLQKLAVTKINRLSIGIQSFFEDDLKMMNRAHNAKEAERCLTEATKHFSNISIDLIYGIPGMSNEKWKQNIDKALSFGIPHISSYALTIEPKTALDKFINQGLVQKPNDDVAQQHFSVLVDVLSKNNFIHYELSNFGKENYFSKNNSAYWLGKKYLGIGPSAHSYNGFSRSWNVSNNVLYLKSIEKNILPSEKEILSDTDRYNEYVMTGLRTIWGISLERIKNEFGEKYFDYIIKRSEKFIEDDLLVIKTGVLIATQKGKFLSDGIASDLFWVN